MKRANDLLRATEEARDLGQHLRQPEQVDVVFGYAAFFSGNTVEVFHVFRACVRRGSLRPEPSVIFAPRCAVFSQVSRRTGGQNCAVGAGRAH